MPISPSSVYGRFIQFRRSLPIIRHDLVVSHLEKNGWYNGSVNLGEYVGDKFQLMDAPAIATFMRTHDWIANALDIAEKNDNILEESHLITLLPKAYMRESQDSSWVIRAAFKLFHWCHTVESETAFTLALDDDRWFPMSVRKYLPPCRVRWQFYRRCTDTSLRKKVREQLLLYYLPLVGTIAAMMARGFPKHVELPELINNGSIGLIEALERYDPAYEVMFETYATPRIRGSILDALRAEDWVPRSVRSFERQLDQAVIELTNEFGCKLPQLEAVAERMDISYNQLLKNLFDAERTCVHSLDAPTYTNDESTEVARIELVADEQPSALTLISFRQLVQALKEAMKELNVQERTVITLYYWHEYTTRGAGVRLGLSESRISQIKKAAEAKLRKKLCNKYSITNPTRWYESCLIVS